MTKSIFIIYLISFFQIGTAQTKQITEGIYQFELDEKFVLVKKDNNALYFTYFDKEEKLKTLQKIGILETGISPENNDIKKISDFANLETISIFENKTYKKEDEISGMTKIKNIEVFYLLRTIRKFKDSRLTKLSEYNFIANYYFFYNKKIYKLFYTSDLMTSVDIKYNESEVSNKMKKVNNLGYLNLILETLKIN